MHSMLTMKKAQVVNALLAVMLLNILGHCETSIYPGLRRKPMQQSLQQQYELPSDFLAQLMEENARRRLQQQFEQQLELINMQLNRQRQLLERERYRQRQEELQTLAETEDDYANNLNNQYDQYDNVEFNYNRNTDVSSSSSSSNNNNNNNNVNSNNNINNRYTDIAYTNRELNSNNNNNRNSILRERIPFAVGPSDARFFETDNEQSAEFDTQAMSDYEEYAPTEAKADKVPATQYQAKQLQQQQLQQQQQQQQHQQQKPTLTVSQVAALPPAPVLAPAPVESPKLLDGPAAANFHRIKPQTAAAAAVAGVNLVAVQQAKENGAKGDTSATASTKQHEISALIEKLQKQSKSSTLLDGTKAAVMGQEADHIVLRQHLGMDSEYGVYIVALIAGVSAAVTVGLIALGITWLHNRSKATADVEYPAYGITGPNKEISPSGDRKLAHSAQMYHYQHQKQQIIAMENRQCAEGSCGISDVESDDDNEEGDYTVYECPGLAPTEEMEVKNPLFLDETPATPANNLTPAAAAVAAAQAGTATPSAAVTNNLTQAQPQQPPTAKKGGVRSLTSLLISSNDDKDKNSKKKTNK